MNTRTTSNELSSHFNTVSDAQIAYDLVWQSFGENPSVLLNINHYASTIANNQTLNQQAKESFEFFMLLWTIQNVSKAIERSIENTKALINKHFEYAGDLLDHINDLQEKMDLIHEDHDVVKQYLDTGNLKEKESTLENEHIKNVYERAIARNTDTSQSFEKIMTDQLTYEQDIYLPWLIHQRNHLGGLYIQSIEFATNANREIKSIEEQYKDISSNSLDDNKLSKLTDLEERASELEKQAEDKLEEFEHQKETVLHEIDNDMITENLNDNRDIKEVKTVLDIKGFGI